MKTNINGGTYRTLDDIRQRKDQLLNDISGDSTAMQTLWDSTFHKPAGIATPSSRFSGMMKTGIGVLDGVILGWKLYRRFKPGSKKKTKKGFLKFF